MAKVFRMRRRSADEILVRAANLEARAGHAGNRDDPAWLLRKAGQMRAFALRRQETRERKFQERQKRT
jgi:hypothetical protein